MIDNILVVSPPDYKHSMTFFDTAYAFQQSLPDTPILTTDPNLCEEGTTLIFGAHLIPAHNGQIDLDSAIIFQSEQLSAQDSLFATSEYISLLKRYPVWDYSTLNIATLKNHGIEAKHVPLGYNRCMSNIKTGKSVSLSGRSSITMEEWSGAYPPIDMNGRFVQDVDVCFYGSVNDRRLKIIEELKNQTIDGRPLVVASFIGYGGFRDKMIARSKIVLNMHYYDSAIFEIFRCAHLFANKKCVVSEMGSDEALESPYINSGCMINYDGIVVRCMELLHNEQERNDIADNTHNIFRRKTQADILKGII